MTVTREVPIIPASRGYYRRELDQRKGGDWPNDDRLRIAAHWIAQDVIDGDQPNPGLVWVFRALDRLDNIAAIVRREQQIARAAEHGVVKGARVRVTRLGGREPVEGIVGGCDGLFMWFDGGPRDVSISDLSRVEVLTAVAA